MKYFIALLSFFIFFNYSCKESNSKTINSEITIKDTNKKENKISNNLESNNPSDCKVTTQGQNIILNCANQQTIYRDLIINEMSVSTELIQETGNRFSLLYELNASDTKIKEKYTFTYSSTGLVLAYKEVIKFGREGISLNKLYFDNFVMNEKTYHDLQSLMIISVLKFRHASYTIQRKGYLLKKYINLN